MNPQPPSKTSSGFSIRAGMLEDVPVLADIWLAGMQNAIGHAAGPAELESLRQELRARIQPLHPNFGLWVAVSGSGEIIGWQSLQSFTRHPMRWHLEAETSTYAKPRSGFTGVGKALTRRAMEHANCSTLEFIIGIVISTNHPAMRMFIACGWRLMGTAPSLPRSPSSDLVFLIWPIPVQAASEESGTGLNSQCIAGRHPA